MAFFAAGLATFVLVYAPQPLLPTLSSEFSVSTAESTLVLSTTTALIGLSLIPAGVFSDGRGRRGLMIWSLALAALLGMACAVTTSFWALVGLRAAEGVAVAGLIAIGPAYLAEEVHASSLGMAMGLYLAGNAIGGMVGRVIAGGLADAIGWRAALLAIGVLSIACVCAFARLLPPSKNFRPRRESRAEVLRSLRGLLAEPALLRLNLVGSLLMASFVATYSAVAFRLEAAPFLLSAAAIGAVYLIYPIGSASAVIAGAFADRIGRRTIMPAAVVLSGAGLVLTGVDAVAAVVAGLAILTIGFFAGHSLALSWVGRRAQGATARTSALYSSACYGGAALAGPGVGVAWDRGGWTAVTAVIGTLLLPCLAITLSLRRIRPSGAGAETAGRTR